jgi:hypothetical protein
MKKLRELLGITFVKARPDDSEFDITFAVKNRSPMQAILNFGVAEQMASAFAQLSTAVREHQSGTTQAVIAQVVKDWLIQRDQWNDQVTIRFFSEHGTPYTFSATPENAEKIAERLRIEALKPHQMGSA